MRRQLWPALKMTVALLVLCCAIYPAAVWTVGRVAFRHKADGSLVTIRGKLVGSSLIGQNFSDAKGNPLPRYFQPRPSAAGAGYDAMASSGSNLGPSSPVLLATVAQRVEDYRSFNGLAADAFVPVDAVTASGSGLDPDISVANALDQTPRVARARRLSAASVEAMVTAHVRGRPFGIFGERAVNVLEVNLALDEATR